MHSRGPIFCAFEVGVGFAWEFFGNWCSQCVSYGSTMFPMVIHSVLKLFPSFHCVPNTAHFISHPSHKNCTLVNPIQNSPKEKTTINYDHSVFCDGPANQRHPFRNKFELGGPHK
jgi:hypothetical protein